MDETAPHTSGPLPHPPTSVPSSPSSAERFPPGTVLASRYRIVSRLGRGGMGEVYRADDLTLGVSVALKFLPHDRSHDPLWRDRLLKEVRTAREVTHPNVCRVFDLVEHEGQFFLTMEYIDGEDLSSLLRRIGRFPEDRAIEIARQICLGLAAAHEEGILHRDLKPANVMLDGRGRIKITDFGLAALTDKLEGPESRAGTLAYMAPEQREGKEVTRKSDIYSLGLVLTEVFTGKPQPSPSASPLDAGTSAADSSRSPTKLTSSASRLDPAIQRILARCLAPNPADRPNSAFAVAAALPGGDPLQAALAAGETPSPEMVADSIGRPPLKPWQAIIAVALVFLTLLAHAIFSEFAAEHRIVPLPKSPIVLADRADEIARALGRPGNPSDVATWLERDGGFYAYLDQHDHAHIARRLATDLPATFRFAYRSSQWKLQPLNAAKVVSFFDPGVGPGATMILLSPAGKLIRYARSLDPFPATATTAPSASQAPIHWPEILKLMGLDPALFTPTDPAYIDDIVGAESRLAWVGRYSDPEPLPVRVEAGITNGSIVYLRTFAPWELPAPPTTPSTAPSTNPATAPAATPAPAPQTQIARLADTLLQFLTIAIVFGIPIALAIWQIIKGRPDYRGGLRVALVVLSGSYLERIVNAHWPPLNPQMMDQPFALLAEPVQITLLAFCAYIVLEPLIRTRHPALLVAWARLTDGRFRDPVVASSILVGLVAVIPLWLAYTGSRMIALLRGQDPMPLTLDITLAESSLKPPVHLLGGFATAILASLIVSLLFTLSRIALRKSALTLYILTAVVTLITLASGAQWLGAVVAAVLALFLFTLGSRWGHLTTAVTVGFWVALQSTPYTLSTQSWWWPGIATQAAMLLALALFCLRNIISPPQAIAPRRPAL